MSRFPLDQRQRVKLRTRGRWGVQAGLLAGIAVAAFFFVADLARGAPLSTPLFLSQALLQQGSLSLESGGVIQTLTGLSLGGRLAAFTALHLAMFTTLGVFAAGMSNLFHVRWNARTGAAVGLVMGFSAWLAASKAGTAWLAGAQLTPEIVVGAGIVGGAVLGWHLRLCHMDAEETRKPHFRG
jgi:hypothetical protein